MNGQIEGNRRYQAEINRQLHTQHIGICKSHKASIWFFFALRCNLGHISVGVDWGHMDIKQDKIGELPQTRRLTTILVADICGYSKMSERNQDHAIRTADLLYKIFETTTQRHGGRVFNRIADGFLAEFPSARSGMMAALDYCKEIKARNNLAPNAIEAEVRAGIHVGDVTDRPDGDILGHGVNIAARLQEQAAPGMILASSNIVNLLGPAFPHKGTKMGALSLKNISEAVTAYQIDPEKSAGRFSFRIPKILKSKALLYTAVLGTVFYGAMTLQGQRSEAMLDKRIAEIFESNFAVENSNNPNVNQEYIDEVLRKLYHSKISTHRASFALIEKGNIAAAIDKLDQSLNTKLSEEVYIETLHQIGALSFNFDPVRARSVYETILKIDPMNKQAMLWLVRNRNMMVEPIDVSKFYQQLISDQKLTEKDSLNLQTEMAFGLMLNGEFKASLEILTPMEAALTKLGDERLFIEWQIHLAIAYERTDKLSEAEASTDFVIQRLNSIGADGNLARAHNIKGLILEKKAEANPANKNKHLTEALKHYNLQFSIGEKIGKKRELAEALHYMGRIQLQLGSIQDAENNFRNSYRIARQIDNPGSEFKSLLGFAQVARFRGDNEKSCNHIREAERVFVKKMGPNLGPTSRKILNELGCGFSPIEI